MRREIWGYRRIEREEGSSLPGEIAPEVYAAEMEQAAKLMDWKGKWKGRGQWDENGWKRGLGMAIHTWTGRAGAGTCTIKVQPDGSVQTFANDVALPVWRAAATRDGEETIVQ